MLLLINNATLIDNIFYRESIGNSIGNPNGNLSNNNNNKYLLEKSYTFFSYEVYKLIILLFTLKGFR